MKQIVLTFNRINKNVRILQKFQLKFNKQNIPDLWPTGALSTYMINFNRGMHK